MTEPTDDEIIAQERRSYRRALAITPALFLLIGALLAVFFWAQVSGIIPKWFSESVWLPLALAFFICLVVGMAYRIFARPPKAAMKVQILRKQIDDHHRRWWIQNILIAVLAIEFVMVPGLPSVRDLSFKPTMWLASGSFIFAILAAMLVICFGPGFLNASYRNVLNDELTLALRARAIRLGFLIAIPGMGLAYLAALHKPEWGLAVLPPAIAAAIALPALYLAFLEWRAGRDG